VSAGAVTVILLRISPAEVGSRLSRVQWPWIALLLTGKLGLLTAKHRRWLQVLRAMDPGPWRSTFRAVAAGHFLNLALPFKLGEVVRSGMLRRHNPRAGLGDGLATVGSERLLDAAVLALLSALALPWIETAPWFRNGLAVLLAVLGLSVVAAVTVPQHLRWIRRLPVEPVRRFLLRVAQTIERGTDVWRSPGRLALAGAWTVLIWCFDALILLLATRALYVPIDFAAALVVTLLYAFGVLIPSGPVQAGTHQALAVVFLAPFGVDEVSAVSVSLVLSACNLAVLGLAGAPALVWESLTRREAPPPSPTQGSGSPTA